MEIYRKSIAYSNKIIAKNICGRTLLDIGGSCCPQRTNSLAELVDSVSMVDIVRPKQNLASNITFILSRAEDLDSTHGLFDEVVLSNILEHTEEPTLVLDAIKNVLANSGQLHILSPNCESLNRKIGVLTGAMKSIRTIPQKEIELGHKKTFSVKDIEEMLDETGYKIIKCEGILLKPVPTPEMITCPEERIHAFIEIAKEIPPALCHEVYFKAIQCK